MSTGRLAAALFALGVGITHSAAGQQGTLERAHHLANSFNVLAYNIFMRPTGSIFADDQWPRARVLPSKLGSFDAIVFSEAFDDDIRSWLRSALGTEYPWQTPILGSDGVVSQNGGVTILSRWPITAVSGRLFQHACKNDEPHLRCEDLRSIARAQESDIACTGRDCEAEKGVQYARIEKSGRQFHLFASHLQSGTGDLRQFLREQQLRIIRAFVEDLSIPEWEPVLFAGDLNVDRYNYGEFTTMLATLDAFFPRPLGYSHTVDELSNIRADGRSYLDYVLVSNRHMQPIEALIETLRPLAPHRIGGNYHLSDHYPVFGQFMFPSPAEAIVAIGP